MRHHNNKRKFGREKNQRNALMKGLVLSMIAHGRIETTLAKARELRPMMEKFVTLAKKGDLSARRLISKRLYGKGIEVKKLVDDIAPKYIDRNGGYTRIVKLDQRKGDGSEMALIEFV